MRIAKLLRAQEGVAAVEAALILPVFLLLALLVVDFSFAFQARNGLASALTLGAQYAVQTGPDVTRESLSSLAETVRKALEENAGRIEDLKVEVTFNGTASPQPVDQFYCAVGTSLVPAGAAATRCADGSMAGWFMTIDASGRLPSLFPGNPLMMEGVDLQDSVTVRLR